MPSSREVVGQVVLRAQAVVVTSGGIGANAELVRQFWPGRLGAAPRDMVTGVPAYVDGSMLEPVLAAGARLVNRDRMWHYTGALANHSPVWPGHGIRILPGPTSLWLDATGRRLPAPYLPGFDTLGTLAHLRTTAPEHDHSWFVATRTVLGKEYALSGSEQNRDLSGRSVRGVLRRVQTDVPAPVQAFVEAGTDVVQAVTVEELVAQMNVLVGADLVDAGQVRLRVLTRKTLGGVQTDLHSKALDAAGQPVPGLFAAGEVAGFGGGGMDGYRSLEGTFLGGLSLLRPGRRPRRRGSPHLSRTRAPDAPDARS